jgi:hypothetical protein
MHNKVLLDVGYKAKFETTGTDVAVTLVRSKDGVTYLWRESPLQNIRWQIKG